MSTVGLISLLLAFVAAVLSALALLLGHIMRRRSDAAEILLFSGRVATIITAAALTVACGVIVVCLFNGDYSIQYVLDEHPHSNSLLFKISGLWAGREGSLLLWAWIISIINAVYAARHLSESEPVDDVALMVMQLVLAAFSGVMLFSEANMPFTVTDEMYLDSNGSIATAADLLGMNTLLEHWAMAIHPPTLFVGYAGLTAPFAYAVAAVVCKDFSNLWVERSERIALFSWLFLTVGIGLGAVWAYVVLGWGGYWGWDPVENASLLAWLVCVALIHSFTVCKQHGSFKGWAVMCACLAFCFCIVGTFISRSGLVQSVHAFEGDPVSLMLFGALMVISLLAGIVGCLVRRKSMAADQELESMVSKGGAHFVSNLIMVIMAVLLAYLTLSSALPSWMPFGGESVPSGTYNAIARPIGVVYLLMMAACPLLSWRKTDPKAFARKAKIPGICALVLFILLMVYFVLYLVPVYHQVVAAGDSAAEMVLEQGPAAYYFALTVVAFLTASLLLFNSLFQLARVVGAGKGGIKHPERMHKGRVALVGGCVSHIAMGVILIGLVGSSMYVSTESGYLPYDAETDTCSQTLQVRDYELEFTGSSISYGNNQYDIRYTTEFDVYRDGKFLGHVSPEVQMVMNTMQQKLNASVLHLPHEDLFVIYQGASDDETALSMEVRVNPLISVVWVGFVLLALGMLLSMLGRRKPRERNLMDLPLEQRAAAAEERA